MASDILKQPVKYENAFAHSYIYVFRTIPWDCLLPSW